MADSPKACAGLRISPPPADSGPTGCLLPSPELYSLTDEENGLLTAEEKERDPEKVEGASQPRSIQVVDNVKFLFWTATNTLATIAIVRTAEHFL